MTDQNLHEATLTLARFSRCVMGSTQYCLVDGVWSEQCSCAKAVRTIAAALPQEIPVPNLTAASAVIGRVLRCLHGTTAHCFNDGLADCRCTRVAREVIEAAGTEEDEGYDTR